MSKLTYSEAHRLFSYCPFDGVLTRKITTSSRARAGDEPGHMRDDGYKLISYFGEIHRYHRVVWLMYYGEWPKYTIDHINGITSDNRITNLRDVTHQENHRNTRLKSNNSTGVNGVSLCGKTKRYRAYITNNGKQLNLGQFDCIEDAAKARIAASVKYGYHLNHGAER